MINFIGLYSYKLKEHRSLDAETIYEYLKKLEGAFLLHRCSRYDIRGKEVLKTMEKYYLADMSLQYAMLSRDPNEIAAMIKNTIYTELCSRGYSVYDGKPDTKKIDYIAIKADRKRGIHNFPFFASIPCGFRVSGPSQMGCKSFPFCATLSPEPHSRQRRKSMEQEYTACENLDVRLDYPAFYGMYLRGPLTKTGQDRITASCPFHDDRHPSFWFNVHNGCWVCEAGCGKGNAVTFLAKLENISTGEAYARLLEMAGGERPRPDAPKPLTLAEYAEQKKLPTAFLEGLGLTDHPGSGARPACVAIPYYDEDGRVSAVKYRCHPENTPRFFYEPGGRLLPYGLWLPVNREEGRRGIVLAEGESDTQSCAYSRVPCLGIPGAGTFKPEWIPFLKGRDVYIHREPDQGGERFERDILRRLTEANYTGRVFSFSCHDIDPGCKDLSDLYMLYGDAFRKKLGDALRSARPLLPRPGGNGSGVPSLKTYHPSELYGAPPAAPEAAVKGMIPVGLSLLAGAPKKGKSFLALLLALRVARGEPFLNMPTRKGDVLYLDLESSPHRVRSRLEKLCVGAPPDTLSICHTCEPLGAGLTEQLEAWCAGVPRPVLIIIDTLGKVKGSGNARANAYDTDTLLMGSLQRFALDRNVAVVCVHHLRKASSAGESGDWLERISGTMGISGACDCVMALQGERGSESCVLSVTGRDYESMSLVLRMENGLWRALSGDSAAYWRERDYLQARYLRSVVGLVRSRGRWEGTAFELAKDLLRFSGESVPDPRKVTAELKQFADLLREREGISFVRTERKKNRRALILTQISPEKPSVPREEPLPFDDAFPEPAPGSGPRQAPRPGTALPLFDPDTVTPPSSHRHPPSPSTPPSPGTVTLSSPGAVRPPP